MTRLTRKCTIEDYYLFKSVVSQLHSFTGAHDECPSISEYLKLTPYKWGKDKKEDALNKLGKFEDIEEELGCPLDVLFEALKNGVYTLTCYGDMVRTYDYLSVQITIHNNKWKLVTEGIQRLYLNLKDYDKTWWLEKP